MLDPVPTQSKHDNADVCRDDHDRLALDPVNEFQKWDPLLVTVSTDVQREILNLGLVGLEVDYIGQGPGYLFVLGEGESGCCGRLYIKAV